MAPFTAIALDRLLEPGSRSDAAPPLAPVRLGRPAPEKKRPPLPQVSPALYAATSSSTPDSPSSFPPSPFIVNHKRRGPRLLKTLSPPPPPPPPDPEPPLLKTLSEPLPVKIEPEQKAADRAGDLGARGARAEGLDEIVVVRGEYISDIQEAEAENDASDGIERPLKPSTPMGEFFDALEEISGDGATQSSQDTEDELPELRLNVLMEIARRKRAEEAVENLKSQWQRLSHQLSLAGFTLPDPPTIVEDSNEQSNLDPADELCRQVVIARCVSDSIGRGCSRAEVELEIKPQIESKNFEIARLWDRLQYYEAANREMSQRNQEAVEMARQHRFRQKRRRKWFWASIGLTIAIGSAAVAWSYLPNSEPPSSHEESTADSASNEKI